MGCVAGNDVAVELCCIRRKNVKDLVNSRYNFTSAFSNYVETNKMVGSAFSEFADAYMDVPLERISRSSSESMKMVTILKKIDTLFQEIYRSGKYVLELHSIDHTSAEALLFAWEKKMLSEVKRARVVSSSGKLRHGHFMVAMMGIDSARNAMLETRDSELYPQILSLLTRMCKLWEKVHYCNTKQYEQVLSMKGLQSNVPDVVLGSGSQLYTAAEKLKLALKHWYLYFGFAVDHQREYIKCLNLYVESVKPILDSDHMKKPSPPITMLCREWQQALDGISNKLALKSILNLIWELDMIIQLENEEVKQKKRIERLEFELENRRLDVNKYEEKVLRRRDTISKTRSVKVLRNDPLRKKQVVVEVMIERVEEEKEKLVKMERWSRRRTVILLQVGLQEIFSTLIDFSRRYYDVHERLLHQFAGKSINNRGLH